MAAITTVLFVILMYVCVIITVATFCIFSPFVNHIKLSGFLTRKWARSVLFFLKVTKGISHEVIGLEKLPDEPCIIACKHQSMWDTLVFHTILNGPSYIYKKELHKVPIYGWYVKRMGNIAIDREASASALKDMIKGAKKVILEQKRHLIIFPQGTRTPDGASTKDYPYQVGVAALYKSLGVKVVPVKLDSGKFWGKGFTFGKKGKIKLEILDVIEPGLSKDEFMKELEGRIENYP